MSELSNDARTEYPMLLCICVKDIRRNNARLWMSKNARLIMIMLDERDISNALKRRRKIVKKSWG